MNHLLRLVLVLWAALVLIGGSTLLARHLLTLPVPPPDDPRLIAALSALRPAGGPPRWLVLHVLYERCGCSQDLLRALRARAARPGVHEQVLLASEAPDTTQPLGDALRGRGFGFRAVRPEELAARYHLEAAPLLLVVDDTGRLRYLGGYSPRKRGAPQDQRILAELQGGRAPAPLPTFGCAVSAALRAALDPLRIGALRLESN